MYRIIKREILIFDFQLIDQLIIVTFTVLRSYSLA